MITEEKLPLLIKNVDCGTGCVEAIYRTVLKRDGVVIHTINDHKYVKVENAEAGLVEIEKAVLIAIEKRDKPQPKAEEKNA